jgi:hypothetical protein
VCSFLPFFITDVPARAAYKDIIGALKGCYMDHQLAMAYFSQLKLRLQLIRISLQEFDTAIRYLAQEDLVGTVYPGGGSLCV